MVPVMVGESPTSMLPVLVNPLPVMLYETSSSVMPGATSKRTPREPTESALGLSSASLAQPVSCAPAPSANNRAIDAAPDFARNLDLLCQYFMDLRTFRVRGSRPRRPALGRAEDD